ncbi:MAG TPA: alanine racemase, partial [Casimicrobiaceae bacterium]|nr:alanine racemase [Casimicrobiaceae bacterium]
MARPLVAQLDLDALAANVERARACAPGARVLAVVKANAYGHGLTRVLPALGAADGLALIEIDAAVRLREQGEARPILLLEGFFEPAELQTFAEHRLSTVVHSAEQVAMLEGAR